MSTDNEWLSEIFRAADEHSEAAGDLDFGVGDLQILFAVAFRMLTPAQRTQFFNDPDIIEFKGLPEYESLFP